MIKIVQFCKKFDVLLSGENNPWTGGVQCLTSSGAPFLRDLRQGGFYRKLEEATGKRHDCWLGGWGFTYKASRSYFQGQGKLAKA